MTFANFHKRSKMFVNIFNIIGVCALKIGKKNPSKIERISLNIKLFQMHLVHILINYFDCNAVYFCKKEYRALLLCRKNTNHIYSKLLKQLLTRKRWLKGFKYSIFCGEFEKCLARRGFKQQQFISHIFWNWNNFRCIRKLPK